MRTKLNIKEIITWICLLILILSTGIAINMFIVGNYVDNKESVLNGDLKRFEGEVFSTLRTYESFSQYIYDEISSNKDITGLVYRANSASDYEKDKLRKELYNLLEYKYDFMKKYEFRQLHFHLLNTESFLRVHAPEKYGDILKDVREGIRLANEFKRSISGFEEGRIYNGFRFIYPLQYEDEFIGTVEVSISSASILKVLSELYFEEDFQFVIYKDVVEDVVFETRKDNYTTSNISDIFYVDKDVEKVMKEYNSIISYYNKEFFQGFQDKHLEKMKQNSSFSVVYRYDKKDYKVNVLSIRNISDKPVAFLMSIAETEDFIYLRKSMYRQLILVNILLIIIGGFTLALSIYQHKLRNMTEVDYLTKIYNRQKLFDMADKEIKRSKRYGFDTSILIFDIDHFKKVNDTHGHNYGDQVLKELTKLVSKNVRANDIFARWGGEEFVLLLPQTNKEEGLVVAEKIRRVVAESQEGYLKDITISVGVALIDSENYHLLEAIERADQAMYTAKQTGRNRVYG